MKALVSTETAFPRPMFPITKPFTTPDVVDIVSTERNWGRVPARIPAIARTARRAYWLRKSNHPPIL